jgi:hypothetical protein
MVRRILAIWETKVKVDLEDNVHPGDTIVVPESWF